MSRSGARDPRLKGDKDTGCVRKRPVVIDDLPFSVRPLRLGSRRTFAGGEGQRDGVYRAEQDDRCR
ncbi:MAG: hypothetical protein KJN79_07425 [Gammaproteobacteria bacterium]|nr:hypothetical protein [Gammaproteobacteria bacterium]